jgi:NOL1/NOP2/sun family putative RNA methylase
LDLLKSLRLKVSLEAKTIAERYGYLPYMIERYLELFGREETLELLQANELPLPETLRCNDFLVDCNTLTELLGKKGFTLIPLHLAPHGLIVVDGRGSIGATLEYLQGYYYIQDPGSMLVAYELEPRPGDLVLDMAAAPGGKATQILQLARDKAHLLAVDISRRRIRALRSHLSRMRFTNFTILRGDSMHLNADGVFDKVLLDAPSSGEGIIRKDPSRKRSRSLSDIAAIASLQVDLLRAAARYVKPGGVIVYSACTIAPEEGELVVSQVLQEVPNLTVETLEIPHTSGFEEYFNLKFDPRVRRCGRLLPHIHGTEGFFICKLRRR